MSVTSIHQCRNLKAMINYCTTPKPGQEKERVAAMYSDLGNCDLFLKYGENTIKAHHRKVQGYTLLQSFPKTEFDVSNEEHFIYVNELGRKLSYALYPNSPCLVITHADSDGECLHNHILVLNHDLQTDKCICSNRHHRYVKEANDKLMEKYGLEVCQPSKEKQSQREYWSNKRNNWLEQLKVSVDKALSTASTMQEFQDNLIAEGVTPSLYKANGMLKARFTYTVTDSDGTVHKKRSDKLGEDYSREAIEKKILSNKSTRKRDNEQPPIMSMSEWIEIKRTKEMLEQQEAEKKMEVIPNRETVTQIDVLETMKPNNSKKEEDTLPEMEFEMKQKEIINQKIQKDKEYQKLKKKRQNIQIQIDLLEDRFEKQTDTEDDFPELQRLQKELNLVDVVIAELTRVLPSDVSLDESQLPTYQPDKSKDNDYQM